ncbi:MAG: metal-sensitive transcriptional regulator [Actinomycetota bacterium]|nr:metal-sensitive transcriptional regulator [Actinomycetota bacterium]
MATTKARSRTPRTGTTSAAPATSTGHDDVGAAGAATTAPPGCQDAPGCDEAPEMMPTDKREEALARLARANGQVQGISRMVEQGRHCTDVLQQIAAVQKALDGVGTIVLRNYLERCVTTAIESGDPLIYDELMRLFSRYR